MYLKWCAAVIYCVLVMSLANMKACTDTSVIHAGAFNHVEEIP